VRIVGNLRGRVTGVIYQDFLRGDGHIDCMTETLDIKLPVGCAVLHQVQRSQVARRIVQEHVFAARNWRR